MARVTVEDCIEIVPNRFDLVLLAAKRARDIASGASITVPRDNDKNPVVALREIADKTIPATDIHEAIVKSMQRLSHMDDQEDDLEEELDQDYAPPFEAGAISLEDDSDDDLTDDMDEDSEDDEGDEIAEDAEEDEA